MSMLAKIRSWHVSLLGAIIQAIVSTFLFSLGGLGLVGVIFAAAGIIGYLLVLLALIVTALLYFQKTRLVGAILAILLGIASLASTVGIALGIFLIIAAILHFWKKI